MIYPLLIPLIFSMIIIILSSNLSSKTSSYVSYFKVPVVKQFVYQEKAIKEGIDSFCRNNFNSCFDENATAINVDFNDILDYTPTLFNLNFTNDFYNDLVVDRNNSLIILTHNMNSENRDKYNFNPLNLNYDLECENGSALPCNSNYILKKFVFSEELKTLYLKKDVLLLEASKADAETEDENATIDAKIDVDLDLISDLNITITNRTVKGFI